jgi:hypothetical protein
MADVLEVKKVKKVKKVRFQGSGEQGRQCE